jgi:heme oxygenase
MDILEKLREETRGDHDELEATGMSGKIMDATLQPEEYKRLIKVHYLVHRALEERLAQADVQQHFPEVEFEKRKKLPLIEQDLAELGLDEQKTAQMQPAGQLPEMEEPYGLLGAMYVMEGATLGGMVIMKALKKNEQLSGIDHFHYFGCYGGDTGKQWKSFLEVLKEEGNKPEAQQPLVKAASQTYQFFKDNFQAYLQE